MFGIPYFQTHPCGRHQQPFFFRHQIAALLIDDEDVWLKMGYTTQIAILIRIGMINQWIQQPLDGETMQPF